MERRNATVALAWAIGGILLGVAATWLAAAPGAVAPASLDAEADEAAPAAPPTPFSFADDHAFLEGGARVPFEVPPGAAPANLEAWFDGVSAGASGHIRILAPDGSLLLETRVEPGNLVISPGGGRTFGKTLANFPLAPGTHVVAYDGNGALGGHVRVASPR